MNVHFVSLGCPKNRVDTEVMLGHTAEAGHQLVAAPEDAEVIVVNTCGFIGEAKEESIDTILEMARYKEAGHAASGWSSPAACRSATRRSWPRRCPRSITSSARARSARSPGDRAARIDRLSVVETPALPLRRRDAAPPLAGGAHRLREDRRGLRSPLRVLHHPEAARPAAQPLARVGASARCASWSRGGTGRSTWSRRT